MLIDSICTNKNLSQRIVSKVLEKELDGKRLQKKNQDYPDHSNVKIS